MMSLALGLNLMFLAAMMYLNCSKSSVVTFDDKLLMKQFVTQLSQKNLNAKQTQALSTKFAKSLKMALEEYAYSRHSIVLKKEQTMSSSADITQDIATRVAKKMRGQS